MSQLSLVLQPLMNNSSELDFKYILTGNVLALCIHDQKSYTVSGLNGRRVNFGRTDGRRKNRSKGYYSSLNALGSADFMKSRSKIRGSLYDIAWRTKSIRQGSVRRGGRHLLSWISVNSPASRTSRAWNQETLQRPQWIHCRRNPLLARNIPETWFSQEKYIQYKITKIVHIVEVKKHIMSAVLFFKKSLKLCSSCQIMLKIMPVQSTQAYLVPIPEYW